MRLHSNICLIFLACIASCFGFAQTVRVPSYQDVLPSVEKRVDDLVSRMTIEEKMSQMPNDSEANPQLGIQAYSNLFNPSGHHYSPDRKGATAAAIRAGAGANYGGT